MSIIGIGEVLWDVYDGEKYIGGAPANFVCDLVQLGHQAHIVSRVGKDRPGEELISALRLRGAVTDYIQTDSYKPTGRVLIKLKKGAIPTFTCIRDVAFDYMTMTPQLELIAKKSSVVLFGSLAQRNAASQSVIYSFLDTSPGKIKIFDANFRGRKLPEKKMVESSLQRATVLKTDKREWRILKKVLEKQNMSNGGMFQYLVERFNLRYVCVSLGRGGCVISTGKEYVYMPGIKITAVDTVGAGDAFAAGFVDAVLRNDELPMIAIWANAIGALVASMNGASPCFTKKDIQKFLDDHQDRVSIKKYKILEF